MTRRRGDDITEIIAWGKKHDAFRSRWGESLLRVWELGAADAAIENHLRQLVHPLQLKQTFGELEPFRMPRDLGGEVLLGRDLQGREIRVPAQTFTEGALLAANTGGGKTNLLSSLLLQFAALGSVAVWVSDNYKTQLRHLRPLFLRTGMELVVLRPSDWKFNPLQSESRNPIAHIAVATDLLVRVLGLPPRAAAIIRRSVHSLYKRFGILDGRTDRWPCLFDLYEEVRSVRGLNVPARDAILDRLGGLLLLLGPRCAAYHFAWRPSDLAKYSIDFEMRGATEQIRQILLSSLLYSVFQNQIEAGAPNGPLRLLVAFDDSQRFFADQQSGDSGLTPMDELAGICRGSGIGLVVNVQTAQGLSNKLRPNLATRLIGRLGSHEDFGRLGGDMGLTREQIAWATHNLRPGRFLGQVSSGAWRHPFVVDVPLGRIPADVTDADVARSVAHLDHLPTVPAEEFATWPGRPPEVSTKPEDTEDPTVLSVDESPNQPPSDETLAGISKADLDYLEDVFLRPFLSTTARDKSLGLSTSKGSRFRRELTDQGLVERVPVNPGGQGGRFILLDVTDRGRSILESLGVRPPAGLGRGGLEHRFWCHTIAEWARGLGATAEIESAVEGPRVDLVIEFEAGLRIAVEVETSEGHESENIRKDLAGGFRRVVGLCKDPRRAERIAAEWIDANGEQIPQGSGVEIGRLVDFRETIGRLRDASRA